MVSQFRYGHQKDLETSRMANNTWAICDKSSGQAIWISNDASSLAKLLNELKLNLGDKFLLEEYKERNESTS